MEVNTAAERAYLVGLARAAGGALIFGLPLFMTMEMWSLGIYLSDLRLALLVVVLLPTLVALSHFVGFEPTFESREDALDALAAFAVAFVSAAIVLYLLGVFHSVPVDEAVRMTTLQAIPASLGALLAQSQLGPEPGDNVESTDPKGYGGQLFIMAIGALFLAFNLAPTQEMVHIAHQMNYWQTLGLVLVSIAVMHAVSIAVMQAFVYSVRFKGQAEVPLVVLAFTLYEGIWAIALLRTSSWR